MLVRCGSVASTVAVHRILSCCCTMFWGCRYVMDVYMPRDRMNRAEHRGFGFVTFETEAAILRVASYGGHMIRYTAVPGIHCLLL